MSSQPTKEQVHTALTLASANIPRYLFRTWCNFSGGHADLNTAEKITPRAFFFNKEDTPRSIFDVPHATLLQAIHNHLYSTISSSSHTYFSSWSDSLAFALSWAIRDKDINDVETASMFSLSVLDASKLDRSINHVHWCGAEALIELRIVDAFEEYQIFGVIHGPGVYRSVPLAAIQRDLLRFPRELSFPSSALPSQINRAASLPPWSEMSEKEKIQSVESAKRIGRAFGPVFGLVVAVFWLSISTPDLCWLEDVLESLEQAFDVPVEQWEGDACIMREEYVSGGTTEVVFAVQAQGELVRRAQARSGQSEGEW